MKKGWTKPQLEQLPIEQTLAGFGFKQIDWITTHTNASLYDPS